MPRRLRRCARAGRGSLIEHPCSSNELARVVRATLRAFPTCPRRGKRGPENQKTDQVPRPGAQDARCSGLPGPRYIAAAAVDQARRVRAWTARIPLLHTDVQLAEPGRWRKPFGQEPKGRNVPGRVSFGDFSLHEQRKVTHSPEGRVEALASEFQRSKTKSLDYTQQSRHAKCKTPDPRQPVFCIPAEMPLTVATSAANSASSSRFAARQRVTRSTCIRLIGSM